MADRSLSMVQLFKNTLGRKTARLLLMAGDLGSAAVIGYLVLLFLPPFAQSMEMLRVWWLSLTVTWLLNAESEQSFRLDVNLFYARVLKVSFFSAVGYLLFFVVTREFYSLRFLLTVTLLWTTIALLLRWVLLKLAPPLRALSLEPLPAGAQLRTKVLWTTVANPKEASLTDFDFVVVDFRKQYGTELQELLTHAHVAGLPILSVPQVIEHLLGKISIEHFNDYWVEATFYINPLYLRLKRMVDLLLIFVLLPILIPLMAIIALGILIFMGRPILYWQERAGLNDRRFYMVKFRTMVREAEQLGGASTEKNDRRITRLGTFLRKLRLDELPQFYNVLKGEMSVIGPRPEHSLLVGDFAKNIPLFQIRHWLRPGITGWAQVNHGYAYASSQEEMREKIRYDLFYLKNLSFWLDLIIIFRTMVTIVTGFGSR